MKCGLLENLGMHRLALAACVAAGAAMIPAASAQTSASGTLDRIRETGTIRLGYRTDARPFSYADATGSPAGYSIGLCHQVTEAVKTELKIPALKVELIPVSAPDRFSAVNRTIDLLCAADTVTLERRTQVAFSIPIFPGGIGALLRADAPFRLREVLSGHAQTFRPTWRANATQLLTAKAFAAVTGTTAETWLARRIDELQVVTRVVPVAGYAAGIDAVLSRNADALFGERAVLLDTVRHRTDTDLIVLDRLFTYEPLALAMKADDEAFRLLVDRALTKFYASGQLAALYTTFFGEPDQSAINFFRWSTPTE